MFGRVGPQVEFVLFGVIFLGLGSLVFIGWVIALIAAAVGWDGQVFASLLVGVAIVPLFPLIGIRWLLKRQEERRATNEPPNHQAAR